MELMKQRSLFEGFSEQEMAEIHQRSIRKSVPRGHVIFEQQDIGKDIFWIEKGGVKTYYTSLSGNMITIGLWSSGDVIGAPDIDFNRRLLSAQVVQDAELLLLSSQEVNCILETIPRFKHNLIAALSFKVRWATTMIDRLATESVIARVAQTILAITYLHGEKAADGSAQIRHLSHQDIADMVGASRPTVSLTLRKLEVAGFIKTAMKKITVVDKEGLMDRLYE